MVLKRSFYFHKKYSNRHYCITSQHLTEILYLEYSFIFFERIGYLIASDLFVISSY